MDHSGNPRSTLREGWRTGSLGEDARSFRGRAGSSRAARASPRGDSRIGSPPRDPAEDLNPQRPPVHPKTMTVSPNDRSSIVIPAIVAMTFRLPASLAARLLEVSAARTRHRERPFHQQDIVAEALTQWLRQQGLE